MREMHDLLELITRWSEDIQKLETEQLTELIRLGGRVVRLLELKNRLPMIWPGRGTKVAADATVADPRPLDEGSFDEDLM
jgi:hypothetical protein